MIKNPRRNAQCARLFTRLVVSLLVLLFTGCDGNDSELKGKIKKDEIKKGAVSSDVVARVDGVEITSQQVRELIDSLDGGISTGDAVDALIENELLAAEAKRRGLDSSREVRDAQKIELARALLRTSIDRDVTAETIDESELKNIYEANKDHFVHTVQRRVRHILVHTGKNGLPEDEAESFASRIAERAAELATVEEFVELYKSVKDEYPGKIRLESLKPFSIESTRYDRDFIEAAFAIPSVGQTSPASKTSFGWHIIFVVEELPPQNLSFEEVKHQLAQMVLPVEKTRRFEELLENLKNRDGVFKFNTAEKHKEPTP